MSWGGTYGSIAQLALAPRAAFCEEGGSSGSSFLLSEEKQFQLPGKLGTSTKAATVMSSNTKHNTKTALKQKRYFLSEQQQRCSEIRGALEGLCSPFTLNNINLFQSSIKECLPQNTLAQFEK